MTKEIKLKGNHSIYLRPQCGGIRVTLYHDPKPGEVNWPVFRGFKSGGFCDETVEKPTWFERTVLHWTLESKVQSVVDEFSEFAESRYRDACQCDACREKYSDKLDEMFDDIKVGGHD